MSTSTASTPPAPGPSASAGSSAPDLAAIRQRQQATWASGDFAVIGVTLQIVGETLAEAAEIRAREEVIDIAAGNGNASLAAAHRFARVTSTDYVPALLQRGRERADAEGLQITFRVADADALPFPDASFDVALSTFGVMFAPDHQRAAQEMLRVVCEGGRLAMANWTPEGAVGQLFRIIGRHVPPPAGLKSPLLWGTPAYLQELFGVAPGQLKAQCRLFNFRYASAAHWVQVFRDYYGPVHKAFAALPPDGQQALERELLEWLDSMNTAGPASLVIPAEYLEVVISKRKT